MAGLDFDNIRPWMDMKEVTMDGQALIWISAFWVKHGTCPVGSTRAGKVTTWISDRKRTGYVIHPAFMKNGVEQSGFYVGKYECCIDPSNSAKAASLAGKAPLVNIDFPTMKARCAARNTGTGEQAGWHLWNIYELGAIQLLAHIEYGGTDLQTLIGAGNVSSSAAVPTGSTAAKYRGICELWGNVWHMVDGLKGSGTTIQIFDRQGNGTYINTGLAANTGSGWTTAMFTETGTGFDMRDINVPKTIDGTEGNGSFSDYYWAATSDFVCYHGGGWGDGTLCGLFSLYLSSTSSGFHTGLGGRLAKYVA